MKGPQAVDEKMVEACRELYLKFRGRKHTEITREMKAAGWSGFYRPLLYTRRHECGLSQGWIERFGWENLLSEADRKGLRQCNVGRHYFQSWLCETAPKSMKWHSPHQTHLYKFLHRITTGRSKRLMIFMPPRHGKSETVSMRYTAYRIECDPRLNVILGSYNQKLANHFSRSIRKIVAERTSMSKHRTAADEWQTSKGGGVKAVGVGAGITGYGGRLVVIDDPVKSRAEAESEAYRERCWNWFNDDIYTRLEPNAAIILIQTRWHEDDLAGRLLRQAENGGQLWDVVCLPAIAEGEAAKHSNDPLGRKSGEALWPERFDVEKLLDIKRQLGTYSFSALYQQRPTPAVGEIFKREWFKNIVVHPPPNLRWYRGYDLAVSTRTTADYTASFRVAKDDQGNIYIADGFRARLEYPEQRRYVIERMLTEAKTRHGVEEALHGKALIQDLRRNREIGHIPLVGVKVDSDKVSRALAWAAPAEERKVILVRGPWIDEFLDELCSFPKGKHDDQIDAVSIAIRLLSKSGYLSAGF